MNLVTNDQVPNTTKFIDSFFDANFYCFATACLLSVVTDLNLLIIKLTCNASFDSELLQNVIASTSNYTNLHSVKVLVQFMAKNEMSGKQNWRCIDKIMQNSRLTI